MPSDLLCTASLISPPSGAAVGASRVAAKAGSAPATTASMAASTLVMRGAGGGGGGARRTTADAAGALAAGATATGTLTCGAGRLAYQAMAPSASTVTAATPMSKGFLLRASPAAGKRAPYSVAEKPTMVSS